MFPSSSFRDYYCDNCGDGSGWTFHTVLGWVACADCNDAAQKPIPTGARALAKEIEALTEQEELL